MSLKFQPRDYQIQAADDAVEFLRTSPPGGRRLYSAPTGTGKSVIELMVLEATPDCYLVTPSLGIVTGLLQKLGVTYATGEAAVLRAAEARGIWTPVRLRNRLADAAVPRPRRLILDEAHHDEADTWDQLHAYAADCPCVGFTATPFRGTPKGTAAFLKSWGDEVWQILTDREAVARGLITMPEIRVAPLLDDDEIEVRGGEILVRAAGEAVMSRAQAIVELAAGYFDAEEGWHRPTMFSVPSVECARDLAARLNEAGLPAAVVTGDTPHGERQRVFDHTVARWVALVQINVVSEGVDLPLRVLIDCSPTLSPVKWLQQVGRIRRPGGESLYVCTNRNLLRHAYLLEGMVPAAAVADAQAAFPPGDRDNRRVIGFEAMGKLKPTTLPLLDGTQGVMYSVSSLRDGMLVEYVALASPRSPEVLYAERRSEKAEGGVYARGRWRRIEELPDLAGFASTPASALTEKQAAWWRRSAASKGLDASAEVNRKNFQALPVLFDIGGRLA